MFLISGCAPSKKTATDKPTVFVSIPPQAGILKALAGDEVEVLTLVGEGQSPHAYEPTARQLAALGEADVLFTIGVPFEQALLKKIKPLYPDLKITAVDASIEKRAMGGGHYCDDCSSGHGAPDPHVWLSALNCYSIASEYYRALTHDFDEAYTERYSEKYEALCAELEELDKELSARLAPFEGQSFYVFHPAFGYFADRYGLEQTAIELDGKSPSPRQLAGLIESAKADGVKVIFLQKQFPAESARAVADAIGGRVVQLDPLAEDVVANLRQIAEAIEASYK